MRFIGCRVLLPTAICIASSICLGEDAAANGAIDGCRLSALDFDVDDEDGCAALSLLQRHALPTTGSHASSESMAFQSAPGRKLGRLPPQPGEIQPALPTERAPAPRVPETGQVQSFQAWGVNESWQLVQELRGHCSHGIACDKDKAVIIICLCLVLVALAIVSALFFFFKEDTEAQVTPLCPQLVVKGSALTFKMPLDTGAENICVVNSREPSHVICKVVVDWPDPDLPCLAGISSTARLQNTASMTIATVVSRNVAASGQALALCRSGCEIFGFMEPETATCYHVKHRTGVRLLSFVGDFASWNVEAINPAGVPIFSAKKEGDIVVGTVPEQVDAGLMISCILAVQFHQRTTQSPQVPLKDKRLSALDSPPSPSSPAQRGSMEEKVLAFIG